VQLPNKSDKSVEIEISPSKIPLFNNLLQSGFMMNTKSGESIETFLCDQMGIDPKYIVERVKTVILDYRPVDNLEKALLHDGSCLTISGGMPGLVGMTLGRGSILAPFRSSITYRGDGDVIEGGNVSVNIKLFNIVMKDLGGTFLIQGINVKRAAMADLIEQLKGSVMSIKLDGKAIEPDKLWSQLEAVDGWIGLSITTNQKIKEESQQ
jgi:hypothetical protein